MTPDRAPSAHILFRFLRRPITSRYAVLMSSVAPTALWSDILKARPLANDNGISEGPVLVADNSGAVLQCSSGTVSVSVAA